VALGFGQRATVDTYRLRAHCLSAIETRGSHHRRGGRAAERAGLENRWAGNGPGGSSRERAERVNAGKPEVWGAAPQTAAGRKPIPTDAL